MTKGKVGRPPELDKNGNKIDKTLVNLTIPVTLKNFLDKHVKNRSEFFTKMVTMLYIGEICPKCYSDTYISNVSVGIECTDCQIWIKLKDCPNCNSRYDPRPTVTQGLALDVPNPHYNPFRNDDDLKHGCSKCMLNDEMLARLKEEEEEEKAEIEWEKKNS